MPSRCPSVMPKVSPIPAIPQASKTTAQRMESGISLLMVSLCTKIGASIEHTPITNIRLKILDPTTLLIANSLLCAIEAVTLTAVSGSDVPIATIVSPIMMDGTFSFFATLELPSTKKSAPLIRRTNPTTRQPITASSGALFIISPILFPLLSLLFLSSLFFLFSFYFILRYPDTPYLFRFTSKFQSKFSFYCSSIPKKCSISFTASPLSKGLRSIR